MSTIEVSIESSPTIELELTEPNPIDLEVSMPGSGGITEDPRIGDLDDLTTVEKGTVVGAINELNYEDVSLVLFYENAKAG